MSDDSEQPYKIEGSKVWLSPTAREWARQYFGNGRAADRKMAEYLLNRHRLGDDFETVGETVIDE